MDSAVSWLVSLETRAGDAYRRSAALLEDRLDFATFLRQLAEDEDSHRDLIAKAGSFLLEGATGWRPEVGLDAETVQRIERPLIEAESLLRSNRVSTAQIIQTIVDIEFSEWNEFFVYFVNRAAAAAKTPRYATAVIESHRNRIERFLTTLPTALRPDRSLRDLPRVWEPHVLLVDDDPDILALVSRFLTRRARVETARDGAEALEKTMNGSFDVIVSDINMPNMDGLEFCRRAIEARPQLRAHFLICSGDIDHDREVFLRSQKLAYVMKPFTLSQLERAMDGVVHKLSAGQQTSGQ